jgi:hypothetical protein
VHAGGTALIASGAAAVGMEMSRENPFCHRPGTARKWNAWGRSGNGTPDGGTCVVIGALLVLVVAVPFLAVSGLMVLRRAKPRQEWIARVWVSNTRT